MLDNTTATKLKIDNSPVELYTLEELHRKVGKLPFVAIKLTSQDNNVAIYMKQFETIEVIRQNTVDSNIYTTRYKNRDTVSDKNIRQWGLLG